MRVLLVEDNSELVSLLKKGLIHGGFSADSVGTAADAAHVLATMRYAAIVLDLGLPDEDGVSLLRDIRRRGDSTPVLVLTARDGVTDRVTGLREGADDYMAKPFSSRELLARIRAHARRARGARGRSSRRGGGGLRASASSRCPTSGARGSSACGRWHRTGSSTARHRPRQRRRDSSLRSRPSAGTT